MWELSYGIDLLIVNCINYLFVFDNFIVFLRYFWCFVCYLEWKFGIVWKFCVLSFGEWSKLVSKIFMYGKCILLMYLCEEVRNKINMKRDSLKGIFVGWR